VFQSWILGATATNSAYMLSAQLAAMLLNMAPLVGNVRPGDLIYNNLNCPIGAPPSTTYPHTLTVQALTDEAVRLLLLDSTTYRTQQLCIKTLLDSANNNLNFALSFAQAGPAGAGCFNSGTFSNGCIASAAAATASGPFSAVDTAEGQALVAITTVAVAVAIAIAAVAGVKLRNSKRAYQALATKIDREQSITTSQILTVGVVEEAADMERVARMYDCVITTVPDTPKPPEEPAI